MVSRTFWFSLPIRTILAIALNSGLFVVIGYAFWRADWQYSVPTQRPEGLIQPPLGRPLALPAQLSAMRRDNRPMVIHFVSAKCPCTEFNLDHLRKLQQRFDGVADFVAVLETNSKEEAAKSEFESMHLRMPVVYDRQGEMSTALGVYGTPQAAILDRRGRLFYRGNYNRSRYCAEESSEYVRIALTALAGDNPLPSLPEKATITYGCPLPRRVLVSESGAAE